MTLYVRQNPKKSRFFRYFLSSNEGNLKFKEPPWKQFHQLQIGERNFHLELSDFEDCATGKSQKIKNSKFLTLYFLKTIFFGSLLTVSCF